MEPIEAPEIAPPTKEELAAIHRQQQIESLRKVLDVLEADPTLPLPYSVGKNQYDNLKFFTTSAKEPLTEVRKLIRAFGGKWDKNNPKSGESYDENYATFTATLEGLHVQIIAPRTATCERVQVGTKVEKRPVTVQEAVIEVQDVEVPQYEFKCEPLFSNADLAKIGN